jgi:IS30 family transposase
MSCAVQEEVWASWRVGDSLSRIARGQRMPLQHVRRYLMQTGGVRVVPPRRSPRQLSVGEREEISRGIAAGCSARTIAARLGRSHTSVSREIVRNGGRERYRAERADAAAWQWARRPKTAKLVRLVKLRRVVEAKLGEQWSPQQVSAWLRREYAGDPLMRVSHETIYLSLFVQSRGALRRELARELRSRRTMRRPRAQRNAGQGRGTLTDMVSIRQRPAEVEDRAVPGHWEGDLIFGRRPSAIGTLVERRTRFVLLFALPDGVTAPAVRPRLAASIGQLPEHLRRSLTWDQGREMAEHAQFSVDSGVQVYFCDPASPWQLLSIL